MIADLATLAVGGDAAEWYRPAFSDLAARLPRVRALLFFHVRGDATVTYQSLDWTFTEDSTTTPAVRDAIAPWTRARMVGGRN